MNDEAVAWLREPWLYNVPSSPLRRGKTATLKQVITDALAEGEHVHVASAAGIHCCGGDPECRLPRVSAPDYRL